ncbi:NADH-quinone oxidoreductase subunit C [Luteococcus sp. H138]|uniref:NADH-quinone oxidoreductase subunit C n=1 Tax=unclassified Luteococcus TaxID=2639923 RepID=UPI00313BF030
MSEDKTINERVTDPEAAPKAGVEREDAQPSGRLDPGQVEVHQAQTHEGSYVLKQSQGMWGKGSPDTSGYAGITRTVEAPGVAQRPFGGWFDEVADTLEARVPGYSTGRVIVDRDELTLFVRREAIAAVCRQLRDDPALRFEVCSVISGVHYPEQPGEELHVVYQLLSITHNRRLRLEVTLPDGHPHVDSVVATYPMADFHEREAWDMFGIIFDGHPGLTRVLMPDDWAGHPQRKDYPLGGIPVEYKGATVPPPDQRRSY